MSRVAICSSEGYGHSVAQPRGRWSPTDEERALVLQKRLLRASWADIARMLRQPVLNVRAIFDPTLDRDFIFKAPEPVERPKGGYRHRTVRRTRNGIEDGTLLRKLASGPLTTPQLGKMIGFNASSIRDRMQRLEREGLVGSDRPTSGQTAAFTWTLTKAGRASVAAE